MNKKFDLEHSFNIYDEFYVVINKKRHSVYEIKNCKVIDKEYPCIDQVLGPYYVDEANGPQMATTNIANYDKCKLKYSCDNEQYVVILFKDGSFEDHVMFHMDDDIELISNDKNECIEYASELIDSRINSLQEMIKIYEKQKESLKL